MYVDKSLMFDSMILFLIISAVPFVNLLIFRKISYIFSDLTLNVPRVPIVLLY